MSYYTDIYEDAVDNYGIITTSHAQSLGVPKVELVKLAGRGRIDRIGYGVYRVKPYVPTRFDQFAEAVALVGAGSYIFGESVLSMYELALVNPQRISVATPKRVRKTLPEWIEVLDCRAKVCVGNYMGIPCQPLSEAIVECRASVMEDRLVAAVEEAGKQGWLTAKEVKSVREGLA